MTASGSAPPIRAAALLERAVGYTRGALAVVEPADLGRPTPCDQWTLRELLVHMDDALAAMTEAARDGRVGVRPVGLDAGLDALLSSIRQRACALVGYWSLPPRESMIELGTRHLPQETLGCVGALEITLHGWDVAQALRLDRPVPEALASDLLPIARDYISERDRPRRFKAPVPVSDEATAEVLLLAQAGRSRW